MKSNYNTEICIIGLGPAGIGALLTLSNSNLAPHVLCVDAGTSINKRSCSVLQNHSCRKEDPCQIVSGVGGCSLFGGKISTFPAGSKLATILGSEEIAEKRLSEAFSLFNDYLSFQKPNVAINDIENARKLFKKLGFEYRYYDSYLYDREKLHGSYQKIFSQLKSADVSILLNTMVTEIDYEDHSFNIIAKQGDQESAISAKYLILGVGRLGRNLLKSLNAKWNLGGREKRLDIGVRLEFPTDLYPEIDKYHNDLKLLFKDARTFCVCKDGEIIPYRLEDMFFTDGGLNPKYESGFTNLAIMIKLKNPKQKETVLDELKKRITRISDGKPVRQVLTDYLSLQIKSNNSSICPKSSMSFYVWADVNRCFPQSISTKIKESVYYFVSKLLPEKRWGEVSVFAPEADYLSLSFPVKSDFSIALRLYVIGDCTGRFRGVLQALCSGIICAENIIDDYNERRV